MGKDTKEITRGADSQAVDAFLRKVARTPVKKPPGQRGRMIFAMDATASREPTWDRACHIQSEMFDATSALGGLEIQLCHYRGFREFEATPWLTDSTELQRLMTRVRCHAGMTQIGRLFRHALQETRVRKVNALVFVGDCMEEEIDPLAHLAGQLGLVGLPLFLFHEGNDAVAARAFEQFAHLSGGACCPFDAESAQQLRELLAAVAVFAAGGAKALENFAAGRSPRLLRLTRQIRKD
jgi:hypothetical protein